MGRCPYLSRRQAVFLLLCGPALLLLAGCGKETPSAAPVTIAYWEKWTGFEGEAMRAVVDRFNEIQKRIHVDLLTVSRVDQKMLLATAGGIPPDVAGLWSYNVNVYADLNVILPLDHYLEKAGITADDYLPCYWDLCVYRGHVWALPTTPASIALHWNKDLFRQAGLDPERPPRTIEQLDDYAEKLTRQDEEGNLEVMGFMPAEPGWWNWAWGCFFGGQLWDGKDHLTADAPENVRAFEWVQSYAKKYGSQSLRQFQSGFGNFSSPQNAFLAGKVAMELQGVWMHNFIDKYAPHLNWGAAPFPHPADRPDLAGCTNTEADILVIPNGAAHPDEAFEFIRYVNSQEGMELLCMGQRKHSPLTRVSPEFWAHHPNPYIRVFSDLAHGRNTFATPKIGVWLEYRDELSVAFDKIWLGEETPAAALGQVQARMQPRFERDLRRQQRLGRR